MRSELAALVVTLVLAAVVFSAVFIAISSTMK